MVAFRGSGYSARNIQPGAGQLLVPGTVIRGVNLVPKAAHVASGSAYRALFAEWDWAGWIKPQIDASLAVGANTIRLIGDMVGVNDGTFTQAHYDACWAELITYCAANDAYAYPAGGGVSQIPTSGTTADRAAWAADTVAAAALEWDTYDNVIGIDVVQEAVRVVPANSVIMLHAADTFATVRTATTKPLTTSNFAEHFYGSGRFANPLWREYLRDHVDFWDLHIYFDARPDLIHQCFWGQGETKPVLIGEFGTPASGGEAYQTRRYTQALDVVNFNAYGLRCAGALAWASFDQGLGSEAFGMFESDGSPRPHMTDVFEQFPIA